MSNSGFIKLMRSRSTRELLRNPNAFALLSQIAYRAKRSNSFSVLNLEPGEALIGDYRSAGLTRQKYRTALSNLQGWGFITIKATNRGTIATLINSDIYDINIEGDNHQDNHQITIQQPSDNHQITTNKNVKNVKKKKRTTDPAPDGGSFLEKKVGQYAQDIKTAIEKLNALPPNGRPMDFKQWVVKKANAGGHPGAILEGLSGLHKALFNDVPIRESYAYLEKIFTVQNPNYNARDHEKECEAFKQIVIPPDVGEVLGGIGAGEKQ